MADIAHSILQTNDIIMKKVMSIKAILSVTLQCTIIWTAKNGFEKRKNDY